MSLFLYLIVLGCLCVFLYAGSDNIKNNEFLLMLLLIGLWPFVATVLAFIVLIRGCYKLIKSFIKKENNYATKIR